MKNESEPILNSYWVEKDHLMAGEYPYSNDPDQADRIVRWLNANKFSYFLDLTEPGEYGLKAYAPTILKRATNNNVIHNRMPVPDMGIPSKDRMSRILDAIDDALGEQHCLYLHCYAGVGRTGTVVGCYLVRHGMDGEDALEQIAQLRKKSFDSWHRSPETEAQRRMVMNWME